MKRFLVLLLALMLVVPMSFAETNEKPLNAEDIDLSRMTYGQLVILKNLINKAMWQSREWQEVTVPQGVWKVGEDIPAGTWTVKCADLGRNSYMMKECKLSYGQYFDEVRQDIQWKGRYDLLTIYNPNHENYAKGQLTEYNITLYDGDYVVIDSSYNKAVFCTYTGKPSLGFK